MGALAPMVSVLDGMVVDGVVLGVVVPGVVVVLELVVELLVSVPAGVRRSQPARPAVATATRAAVLKRVAARCGQFEVKFIGRSCGGDYLTVPATVWACCRWSCSVGKVFPAQAFKSASLPLLACFSNFETSVLWSSTMCFM
jgi:hypothetical protein